MEHIGQSSLGFFPHNDAMVRLMCVSTFSPAHPFVDGMSLCWILYLERRDRVSCRIFSQTLDLCQMICMLVRLVTLPSGQEGQS